jgi:predicted peroxiredoxin
MEVLYLVASGSSDPTRASIPVHLAVNGSFELGHEVRVVLVGDGTELVLPATREGLEGTGVPPMRDLFAKARTHEVPVYV